jgi:hypothetical protein
VTSNTYNQFIIVTVIIRIIALSKKASFFSRMSSPYDTIDELS